MATTKKAAVAKKPVRERKARISVSELNLQKAGSRLLASKLVSTEVSYLQKNLGSSATQEDLEHDL